MQIKRRIALVVMGVVVTTVTVYAGSKVAKQALDAAHWILETSAAYSEKADYSKTIPYVFLGYDAAGKAMQGVAMRSFKTYEEVTALIALRRKDNEVVVDVVDIPDIGAIKDIKKQEKVLEALKGMSGKVVQDAGGQRQPIDAVTGATRYQKRIYLYLDKMSEALLAEMEQDPGWPRIPVKRQ